MFNLCWFVAFGEQKSGKPSVKWVVSHRTEEGTTTISSRAGGHARSMAAAAV